MTWARVTPWALAGLLWTGLVGGLFVQDHASIGGMSLELARGEALASYKKDTLYRRWASGHGGVYVPVTEVLKPSPYLAHVPERDLVTPSGRWLTLVNPAWMTRQVHELSFDEYGVRGHITSLKPLRPENAPDPWERDALEAFERGVKEIEGVLPTSDGRSLRAMFPFVTEPSCLRCHAAQGYKVGEIRGGISVEVPMAPFDAAASSRQATSAALFGVVWLLGLLGLVAGSVAERRRRRAVAASAATLEASERRLRVLFEFANDGIAVADAETGEMLSCNASFAAIAGRPIADIVGSHQRDLHPPEDRVDGQVSRAFAQHAAQDRGLLLETVVVRPDGERRDVEVTATRLVLDGRAVVQGFFRDVTERNRTERALRAYEGRLRAIFAAARDVAFIVASAAPEAEIVEFSPGAERLFLLPRDEAFGRPARDLFDGGSERWRAEVVDRMHRGEEGASAQVELVRANGEVFPALLTLHPLLSDDGALQGELLVVVDISQVKRLEAQVREKQKMEAVGTLAGGIAHDFNNLLTVVLGFVEIELTKRAPDAETRPNLSEVLTAAERARDLVSQILTFSRRTEERRVPVAVAGAVRDALHLLRATLPATLELRDDLDAEVGQVFGDPTRIQQIVINLVTNAYHSLPEATGIIAVALERVAIDAVSARETAGLHIGEYAVLSVTDTGSGIAPEVVPRIFEPFFTTKAPGAGTGLGLAVVHGIVAGLGGVISVDTALGAGTTFRVYLPLGLNDVGASPSEAEASPAWIAPTLTGAARRVLFVDDEPALARLGERLLASLGYRVVACTDPVAALALFRADPDAFDVVITDQTMPGLTGEALARALLALRPGLPVFVCTGHSDALDATRATAAGLRALLTKPYHRRTLATALATACAAPAPPSAPPPRPPSATPDPPQD